MLNLLRQAYPFESSLKRRAFIALLVSCFVFFFLLLFQPFELNTYPGSKFLLILGYAVVAFVVLMSCNLFIQFGPKQFFKEETWTAGKEIITILVMIALIGIGNTLYTVAAGIGQFNWNMVIVFEVYTLSIGIFPLTISILINQARLQRSYNLASTQINQWIDEKNPDLEASSDTLQKTVSNSHHAEPEPEILFLAENERDEFRIEVGQLYYIRSADNYVEIYYTLNNEMKHQLWRSSLKRCEEQLKNYPEMWRCHKSHLVNLSKVIHVSGNAQGFKLHLSDTPETIPVSRSLNQELKSRLSR